MSSQQLSIEDAVRRCAAAAGSSFKFNGTTLMSSTGSVFAELPPGRNPGADDTEWIFAVQLEGTPETVGKQLSALHKATLPPRPQDNDADFAGFEP